MIIIAVRHTSVNVPLGTCYGQKDVELAESFDSEKEVFFNKIRAMHYNVIFSSPLNRCLKLARAIMPGKEIITDKRLMELNFGTWEGLKWEEISQSKEAAIWFKNWRDMECPDGESYRQLLFRVNDFLKDIFQWNSNDSILIVTHAGVIRAMIGLLTDSDQLKSFDIQIDYGGIVTINTEGFNKNTLVSYDSLPIDFK